MVLFVLGLILGGLTSWFITHRYYMKASREQKADLAELSEKLRQRNTLADFERLLTESEWDREFVGDEEIWICGSGLAPVS